MFNASILLSLLLIAVSSHFTESFIPNSLNSLYSNVHHQARIRLQQQNNELEDEPLIRMGHGYDIHRLKEGGKLVIAGVDIPYELGADAHSDGDAVYHSIVDAILGALSTNKDIGMLFPDNDPQWKGADSSIFMNEAVKIMKERDYKIGNVDVTLILQKPKVKDFKEPMKANVVKLLETTPNRVNIKARTHEKVDSVGECRAYECHVVLTLEKC